MLRVSEAGSLPLRLTASLPQELSTNFLILLCVLKQMSVLPKARTYAHTSSQVKVMNWAKYCWMFLLYELLKCFYQLHKHEILDLDVYRKFLWAKRFFGVKPVSIYLYAPTKRNSNFYIILRKPISPTCYDLVQSDNLARLQQFCFPVNAMWFSITPYITHTDD